MAEEIELMEAEENADDQVNIYSKPINYGGRNWVLTTKKDPFGSHQQLAKRHLKS